MNRHFVPRENYNWYWDSLPDFSEDTKSVLRNRFKGLYNKFRHRNIPDSVYEHELSNLREDIVEEVIEYNRLAETGFDNFDDIELNEVSEDTPLINNSGDFIVEVGEEGAAAVATEGPGSTAVLGGIGVGGAIAIGSGVLASKEETSHKKPTFSVGPEHNYLGPGNTVGTENDPAPVDDSDRIAYNHDLNYLKANTEQDVRDADNAAVAEFTDKALQGDWRSALGGVGIQGKQIVEKYTGQLYPGKQLCLLQVNKKLN